MRTSVVLLHVVLICSCAAALPKATFIGLVPTETGLSMTVDDEPVQELEIDEAVLRHAFARSPKTLEKSAPIVVCAASTATYGDVLRLMARLSHRYEDVRLGADNECR